MRSVSPSGSGSSNPAIILSVVVLPHPEGPSSEKNSPGAMSSDTASTAATPRKRRETRSSHRTGAGVTVESTVPLADGVGTFGTMQSALPLATAAELADAAFQAMITAGLAVFALTLYRRLPQRWVAWWAAAWGLYVLRLGLIILFLRTSNLAWLFWHQVATGWVALAILGAALVFSRNQAWRSRYAFLALFPPLWAWVAVRWMTAHAADQIALVALPMVALIAGATLWTGWVFWCYAQRTGSAGARFVAVAFGLWGVHHLDYTFLRARGAWQPWGYFLDILFELAVGIGFGLMMLSELAERLAARTDDLGRLSALMVRQHEAERRRLSRDLHDETAQTLSAVKLEIGMLRQGADSAEADRLDHVLHLVDNGIRGIRRVMNDLRPALLDDLGVYAGDPFARRRRPRAGRPRHRHRRPQRRAAPRPRGGAGALPGRAGGARQRRPPRRGHARRDSSPRRRAAAASHRDRQRSGLARDATARRTIPSCTWASPGCASGSPHSAEGVDRRDAIRRGGRHRRTTDRGFLADPTTLLQCAAHRREADAWLTARFG